MSRSAERHSKYYQSHEPSRARAADPVSSANEVAPGTYVVDLATQTPIASFTPTVIPGPHTVIARLITTRPQAQFEHIQERRPRGRSPSRTPTYPFPQTPYQPKTAETKPTPYTNQTSHPTSFPDRNTGGYPMPPKYAAGSRSNTAQESDFFPDIPSKGTSGAKAPGERGGLRRIFMFRLWHVMARGCAAQTQPEKIFCVMDCSFY